MNNLEEAFAGLDMNDFPEATAEIKNNDKSITTGRTIVNMKSNQLFTGQFEKSDLDEFSATWQTFRDNPTMQLRELKNKFMQLSRAMIRNYHGEVCPIEVMLYTSNIAANLFVNKRLVADIADVVYLVYRENENFLSSIEHILKVWKWEQAITVCEIAVGKIGDVNLLRYIYDNFHYQEEVSYGCFCALMESKNEEFVPEILSMIHDLSGTHADKQIGNIFKKNFALNFPEDFARLNPERFRDSKIYVQKLIRDLVSPKSNNFAEKYRMASSGEEKKSVVGDALTRVIRDDDRSSSLYDALNVLRSASSENISEQLFKNLGLKGNFAQRPKEIVNAVICNYFGYVNYPQANRAFAELEPTSEHYAASRAALFYQGRLDSDELVENFLSETRPDQIRSYLACFWNLHERLPAVRASAVKYLSGNLSDEKLSAAITNYFQMIQRFPHLYDPQVGELIKTWFGYGTVFGNSRLRLQDQNTCLNIINNIIDSANYKKYEAFLYYVAEEAPDFKAAICNLARNILKKLRRSTIKA